MSLFNFKQFIIISLFIFQASTAFGAGFTGRECLEANFETKVSHKGRPFGLADNILNIKKENCLIQMGHEKMRFLKQHWEIDVCRGPIHIKSGTGAVDVARRSGKCSRTNDSAFCQELRELESVLQNDGLIFAAGAKEKLADPHGMVYCTYLILRKYLRDGAILSSKESSAKINLSSGFLDKEEVKMQTPQAPSVEPVNEEAQELFPETQELGDF